MAHKLFSKDALAKLLVTAVVASSSVGYGTVAFAAGGSGTLSTQSSTTTAENEALTKLVADINALQAQLQADGTYAAVTTAQSAAQAGDWGAIIYGSDSAAASHGAFIQAIKNLITLTSFGSLSGDTSTTAAGVQQVKAQLQQIAPANVTITGTDIYTVFESVKSNLLTVGNVSSDLANPTTGGNYTAQVASAIQSAFSGSTVFSQILQANGVNASQLSGIVTIAFQTFDPQQAATKAIVQAAIQTHISVSTAPIVVVNGASAVLPNPTFTQMPTSLSMFNGQALAATQFSYTVSDSTAATVASDGVKWNVQGKNVASGLTLSLYIGGVIVATIPLTVADSGSHQTVQDVTGPNSGIITSYPVVSIHADGSGTLPSTQISGTTLNASITVPAGALQPGETINVSSNVDTSTLQKVINKTIPANQAPALVFGVSFSGAAPSQPITLTIGGGTGKDAIPSNAVVYKLTDTGEIPMPSNSYSVVNGVLTITFSTDPYFIVAVPQGNSGNSNGNGNVPGTPAQIASATNSTVNLSATSVQAGQPVTISGVVKDDAGKAIANRTVIAQFDDKTGVTVSGADGSYSVTLTPDKPVTNGPVTVKVDQAVISNSTDVITTVAQSTVPTPQGPTIDMLKSITFNLGTFKVDSKATTFTKTVGNTTVQVTVPAGAFTSNGFVSVIGTVDPSVLAFSLNGFLPGGSHPEEAFGLLYTGSAPVVPLTVSVTNPAITSGATVFNISTGGASQGGSAQSGSVTVSASSNPYFLVVQIPQPQQPPVSTPPKQGPGPQSHNFSNTAVYVNGKKLAAAQTFVENKTTYMSISSVTQTLKSLGFTDKWDSKTKTWTLTAPKSAKVDFSSIKLNSGDVTIKLNGKVVYKSPEIVATDPNGNTNTFLPVWYVMQMLKRAGINSTWNGSTWKVTGKH